jgi:hypothetical protein
MIDTDGSSGLQLHCWPVTRTPVAHQKETRQRSEHIINSSTFFMNERIDHEPTIQRPRRQCSPRLQKFHDSASLQTPRDPTFLYSPAHWSEILPKERSIPSDNMLVGPELQRHHVTIDMTVECVAHRCCNLIQSPKLLALMFSYRLATISTPSKMPSRTLRECVTA